MSHSYTCLCVHVVFSTKDRSSAINIDIRPRLIEYIGGICRASQSSLIAANTMPDHAHLLIMLHPSKALADLMREVKARSSSFVRQVFPDSVWPGWQEGYGGFSVSRSGIEAVERYIAQQEDHHRTMTFQEEFIALLDRHGVAYNPKYVWG